MLDMNVPYVLAETHKSINEVNEKLIYYVKKKKKKKSILIK
jgi:hypothetical protein